MVRNIIIMYKGVQRLKGMLGRIHYSPDPSEHSIFIGPAEYEIHSK